MSRDDEQPVWFPVFVPALFEVLLSAEDDKGEPLTYDEVITIRDNPTCIIMPADRARQPDESRGYRDIDPEKCWHEWLQLRAERGKRA